MGHHVLSNLQKLKVMNMSCTTSSANVCVVLPAGWWLVQARPVRSTSARPGNFTEMIYCLGRLHFANEHILLDTSSLSVEKFDDLMINYYFPTLNIQGKLIKENLSCLSS